ncbi:DedA family protein [Aquipuribacter hungaricus]|uniref:DedA family protein n=1 Tax=Aquipuribacter hungaricus TaxID=545624 RepID=A0ABV7WK66_9MICO
MSAPAELDGVAGWAVGIMETLGGPGAGLVVALENLFPPIPSEIILPLAGFTAAQGSFSLLSAILWTTAGSLVGALVLYELGRVVGRDRVVAVAGRLPLVDTKDIEVAERWFQRHGPKAVFFGRMLPIIRSAISVPAGVERMPVLQFLLYTLAGSAIWNTIFIVAGYQLGERWSEVEQYATVLQYIVVAVAVLLVGWFVVSRVVRRQRAHPDVPVPPDEA